MQALLFLAQDSTFELVYFYVEVGSSFIFVAGNQFDIGSIKNKKILGLNRLHVFVSYNLNHEWHTILNLPFRI